MSEQTNTNDTPTTNATADKPKRAQSTKRIPHADVIRAYANAHPGDDSAKGLRRKLRNNKHVDPEYVKHVKNTPWCGHKRATLQKLFADDKAFLKALSKVR